MAKKKSASALISDLKRKTRKAYSSEEKIRIIIEGSVASTKFNQFQRIKFKCYKINSIENQDFSYLSDSIFLKEKQKNRQMRQNLKDVFQGNKLLLNFIS